MPSAKIAKEAGISKQTLYRWASLYRKHGEEALKPIACKKKAKKKATGPVREKIVEVKKNNPHFGSRRISDTLRRLFFLKASPETVRRTLKEERLIKPPKQKPKRNPQKPRFFERSTPNQLWQSDIFTFRLGGKNAYLIGYIDDYSRFITGLDLFRSQTADNVISIYRIAVGEYKPPKEMLTDNGRQYTNWRGVTKFERELKKDRVKHLKSRPHHPMTLGKIERFWKTIFTEFLSRAQFDSFENARSRISFWVKYYNHKRPHQGIGGLCPADRFFEIHSALKHTIEKGIKDNVLEMALRGKPKNPFYMVGRMGEQSVVIRAEKGKVKMMVDGKDEQKSQEVEYQIEGGVGHGGKEKQSDKERKAETLTRTGSVPGGAFGVVPVPHPLGGLSDAGHQMDGAAELGAAGTGGDPKGPSAEEEKRERPGPLPSSFEAFKEERGEGGDAGRPLGEEVNEDSGIEVRQSGANGFEPSGKKERIADEGEERKGSCPPEGGSNPSSESRENDSERGSESPGSLEEDVLRVGEEGFGGDDGGAFESSEGPPQDGEGRGEGEIDEPTEGSGTTAVLIGACGRAQKTGGGSSESEGSGSRESLPEG
jgi:transposase InsO family protein